MNYIRQKYFIHIVVVCLIMVIIAIVYYQWQSWFPWFWYYFIVEYRIGIIGMFFVIPFLYASLFLPRKLVLLTSLLPLIIVLPILISFFPQSPGRIVLNLVALSIPLTITLIISIELNWRRRLLDAAKKNEAERQIYTQQIIMAHEDERRHIAQELHDDTIQELLVIANKLEDSILNIDNHGEPNFRENVTWIRDRTVTMIKNLRRLSLDLGPSVVDDLGLVPALTWLADRVNDETNIKAEVIVQGQSKKLSSQFEVGIFRLVQEALNNVRRHSMATNVTILLEYLGNFLTVSIEDNGRGFVFPTSTTELARRGKLGVLNMQQRAKLLNGRFDLVTSPDNGTKVMITLQTAPGVK